MEEFATQGLLPAVKPYTIEKTRRGIALQRNGVEFIATNKLSMTEGSEIVQELNEAYDKGFHDCSVKLLNDKVSTGV